MLSSSAAIQTYRASIAAAMSVWARASSPPRKRNMGNTKLEDLEFQVRNTAIYKRGTL